MIEKDSLPVLRKERMPVEVHGEVKKDNHWIKLCLLTMRNEAVLPRNTSTHSMILLFLEVHRMLMSTILLLEVASPSDEIRSVNLAFYFK